MFKEIIFNISNYLLSNIISIGGSLFFWLTGSKIIGRKNYPFQGRIIVAANHRTYADGPLLGAAIFGCKTLRLKYFKLLPWYLSATDVMFTTWWKRYLAIALRCLPVDRKNNGGLKGADIYRVTTKILPKSLLVVFLEGKCNRDDHVLVQPAKGGLGMLVCQTQAKVLPIYADTRDWPKLKPSTVIIGPLMDFSEQITNRPWTKDLAQKISNRVRSEIIKLAELAQEK